MVGLKFSLVLLNVLYLNKVLQMLHYDRGQGSGVRRQSDDETESNIRAMRMHVYKADMDL
jgi:hypothetical protein